MQRNLTEGSGAATALPRAGLNRNHHASSPEHFLPRKVIVPQVVQLRP